MSEFDRMIQVTLTCGCRLKLRSKPMNPTSKYTCRSGLGHSYNQPWKSYLDSDRTFENPGLAMPRK